MKGILAQMTVLRWAAVIVCTLLGAFAFVLKFCLPGYSFSALVCLALICVILFYCFFPMLGGQFPKFTKFTTRAVSVCLILGLAVFAATEAVIIHASFGTPQENVAYMVVLGAKVRPDGPSVSLWDRIYAAADYLEENPGVTAIVSGGQGGDEPVTEASAMFAELVRLGIDPERIWLEDQATSTWENLHFSLDLIEERTGKRPEKLGVLSSEYHLFRASLFTKACGVQYVGIPARTSRLSQAVNHFMREVAGVWHYILLGGQYD